MEPSGSHKCTDLLHFPHTLYYNIKSELHFGKAGAWCILIMSYNNVPVMTPLLVLARLLFLEYDIMTIICEALCTRNKLNPQVYSRGYIWSSI